MRGIFAFVAALCFCVPPPDLHAAEFVVPGQAALLSGDDIKTMISADFARFDPHYLDERGRFGSRLDDLGRRLADLQAAGHEMECSNEIYLEAIWLHRYTADWSALEKRLADLAGSLERLDQDFATHQSPETGLWGACYERAFFKLEATTLALIQMAALHEAPRYPVHLPPPFDSRAAAFAHFHGLLVSDIAHTGIDNRGELGNISTVASLAYFKDYIQSYLDTVVGLPRNQGGPGARTKEYRREFSQYIQEWQD
ncbi:MAG: hypothetical protein JO255_12080, partial [Alphaproteobacteria bacterium]|nr:hypothetical protein [Alphaproteobacteria bacterium]